MHPSPRALLDKYGLDPKKSWGQNFLCDRHVPARIAAATGAKAGNLIVEIGPGLGHLTAALLETGAGVVAIERDRDMARVLRGELGANPALTLIEGNALAFDLAPLARAHGGPVHVAGNLPYHISSQLLVRLLDARAHIVRFVVMVQKELGERLAAPPGSRTYGALSALCRAFTRPRRLFDVPKGAFVPPPKVTSSVLAFDVLDASLIARDDEAFFRWTVHAAFGQRRKTLRNALGHALEVGARGEAPPMEDGSPIIEDDDAGGALPTELDAARPMESAERMARVDAALARAMLDPKVRAEALDVPELGRLASALREALRDAR